MTNPKRAYYSPTAAEKYGSSIYRNAEGSEVEVTCVEPGLEDTGVYKWVDAEVVGLVTEFIRKGQEGGQAQRIRATSPSFPPITFTAMRSKYIEERWRRYFVFGSYADSPMVDISDGETYTVATMSREHAQTVISERNRLIDTLCQMALVFESAAPAQFEAFMASLWEVASNPLVRPGNHPTTTQEEIQ